MGFKCVLIALALVMCLTITTLGLDPVQPKFPTDEMSGSEIYKEVQGGVYTDINDASLSFQNESLFITNKYTGMSPNAVKKGVRTPVKIYWNGLGYAPYAPAAGNWSFTLTSAGTSYLNLGLYQNGDAVSGSGMLTSNGFNTPVTASGTVLGDRLSLFVTPANTQNLYRFSLTVLPGTMNGDYVFTAPGITQPGVAFGSLLASTAPSVPATQTAAPAAYQTTPASQATQAVQTAQVIQTNQTQQVAPVY